MFSAPTAIRVLKKQDPRYLSKYDISSLEHLFLAGEPLDEPTHRWISEALGQARDRPLLADRDGLADAHRGARDREDADQVRQPFVPGVRLRPAAAAESRMRARPGTTRRAWWHRAAAAARLPEHGVGRRRAIRARPILRRSGRSMVYSTFDWGIRDKDGYYFILGRTDDVINVAGHRLGTREIEEAVSAHPNIAEVAVVGVATSSRGRCRWPSRW